MPSDKLPADITAAIAALEVAAEQFGGQTFYTADCGAPVRNARAALDAAILARLARAERLEAENARLREAVKRMAGEYNADYRRKLADHALSPAPAKE